MYKAKSFLFLNNLSSEDLKYILRSGLILCCSIVKILRDAGVFRWQREKDGGFSAVVQVWCFLGGCEYCWRRTNVGD